MTRKNYYEVLKVARNASQEEITVVYRELAKKWHPDKYLGLREKDAAAKRFKFFQNAYDVLGNPEKRKRYDEKLLKQEETVRKAAEEEAKGQRMEPTDEYYETEVDVRERREAEEKKQREADEPYKMSEQELKLQEQYDRLVRAKDWKPTESEYQELAKQFWALNGYKDSAELARHCEARYQSLKELREAQEQAHEEKEPISQRYAEPETKAQEYRPVRYWLSGAAVLALALIVIVTAVVNRTTADREEVSIQQVQGDNPFEDSMIAWKPDNPFEDPTVFTQPQRQQPVPAAQATDRVLPVPPRLPPQSVPVGQAPSRVQPVAPQPNPRPQPAQIGQASNQVQFTADEQAAIDEFARVFGNDVKAVDPNPSMPGDAHSVGETLLHKAVRFNKGIAVVKFLVSQGADVNAKNGGNITPLREATFRGNLEVARFLISEGADVNATGFVDNSTPLHIVARRNMLDFARLLVSNGADVNAKDNNDITPLDIARNHGHTEMVRLLENLTDNPFLDGELRTPQIAAQPPRPATPAYFDERRVPQFRGLTDILNTTDGRIVNTPELWYEVRRPELLKLFEEEIYGRRLSADSLQTNHSVSASQPVFNGRGTRQQHTLRFTRASGTSPDVVEFDVVIYTPSNVEGKVPAFIGFTFGPPAPIESILDRGYAVIRANYEAIEPDQPGRSREGLRKLIDQQGLPNEGNTIATWALGLSLMREHITAHADALNIDPDRMAVFGFSRIGKTALWAAAQDTGFAMAISVNSGRGGAALFRRQSGETVHHLNTQFPHWFNGNFKKYTHNVNALPVDQHELIALIAPRPVYIASAVEDHHADPQGEFLSGLYADPVFRLLGTDGFAGVRAMPELNRSVGGTIGYHIRSGGHGFNRFDWDMILNFADKHFKTGDNPFDD